MTKRAYILLVLLSTTFISTTSAQTSLDTHKEVLSSIGISVTIPEKKESLFLKNNAGKWITVNKEQQKTLFQTQNVTTTLYLGISLPIATEVKNSATKGILPSLESMKQTLSGATLPPLEIPATDITVEKKENTYDFSGKLVPGYEIDEDYFSLLLAKHLTHPKSKGIIIPSHKKEGKVYLNENGTKTPLEIVARGVSHFDGSTTNRIFNIHTAMTRFIGAQIPAHSDFSFNALLGAVDGSTGYKKELVIKGDETIPEYGGGVCQVSSTFFRAALDGGFPIRERKPHSYAVSYYKPWGTDATIYPGVVDLKFTNDSTSPLIVHPFSEGKTLYVYFYGKKDGRTTDPKGPNIYGAVGTPAPKVEYVTTLVPGKRITKEYGHPGFAAWWERTVTYPSGEKKTEKITSIYEARPGKVLEGKAA